MLRRTCASQSKTRNARKEARLTRTLRHIKDIGGGSFKGVAVTAWGKQQQGKQQEEKEENEEDEDGASSNRLDPLSRV